MAETTVEFELGPDEVSRALGLRSDALAFSGLVISTLLVCLAFWLVLDLQTLYSGLIHVDSTPLSRFLSTQPV